MTMRPKQLAAKFMISTSTLRNYEAKGLIPPAERSPNGYRIYTDVHEAYLAYIQAMAPAFGMEVTSEVLSLLLQDKPYDALWLVREKEVALYEEKARLQKLIEDMRHYTKDSHSIQPAKWFTINEVSAITSVPRSTIRYWEQAGYVTADRDPANHYRRYSEYHLLKIKLLQTLQSSVYSEDTVNIKQAFSAVEQTELPRLLQLAERLRAYLDTTIESQMRGISCLYPLIQLTTGGNLSC